MSEEPSFRTAPDQTTFIVNVMHCQRGKQNETLAAIEAVVRYVAKTKPGFRWSTLARSTDGDTVVNIEAISGEGDVDAFFADPKFQRLWAGVGEVCHHEFHTYRTDAVVFAGANR